MAIKWDMLVAEIRPRGLWLGGETKQTKIAMCCYCNCTYVQLDAPRTERKRQERRNEIALTRYTALSRYHLLLLHTVQATCYSYCGRCECVLSLRSPDDDERRTVCERA